jgi:hypothetical protein
MFLFPELKSMDAFFEPPFIHATRTEPVKLKFFMRAFFASRFLRTICRYSPAAAATQGIAKENDRLDALPANRTIRELQQGVTHRAHAGIEQIGKNGKRSLQQGKNRHGISV